MIKVGEFNEQELKFVPRQGTQVKLETSLRSDPMEEVIRKIMTALQLTDVYTLEPLDAESLSDTYYDTDDLHLYKERNCLRVRNSGKNISITVKLNKGVAGGHFNRDEFTSKCDQNILQREINRNFTDIISNYLSHISGKPVDALIEIKNSRRLFEMKPRSGQSLTNEFRAKLSFDSFVIINKRTNKSSYPMYEIEIEAINDVARSKLSDIAKNIRNLTDDFCPSSISKYEHGIKYYNLDKSIWRQKFTSFLDGGRNLNLFTSIVAVLGVIITIFLGVLPFVN